MAGCRFLKPEEVLLINKNLSVRNRAIFILGINTGFRISELLSLQISDVKDEADRFVSTLRIKKANVKGKTEGRAVPLNQDAKWALEQYLRESPGVPSDPLFRSTLPNGRIRGRLEVSVFQKALKKACVEAEIRDIHLVASHAMKKTFAQNFYEACGKDIHLLQQMLGHSHVNVTIKYLQPDAEAMWKYVMGFKSNQEPTEEEIELANNLIKNAK